MGLLNDRQSRLLIDGKLVAGSAGTFPTINPATEEVLGVTADASADDMGQAIEAPPPPRRRRGGGGGGGAPRRAFDETDWSTDVELRVRCIRQLQQAMRDNLE